MRHGNGLPSLDLAYAIAEIADEFVQGRQLGLGRQVTIKIAHQANPDGDVIQIVAGHMPAIDLPRPAWTDLDLAVARGTSVANDKMIGEPVLHLADASMVGV